MKKCYSKYDKSCKAYTYNGAWYFVYASWDYCKDKSSNHMSSSVYSKSEFEEKFLLKPLIVSVFDFSYKQESTKL